MQQKTTKTDSLVPRIEVMQGRIMGWTVIWIERAERVNLLLQLSLTKLYDEVKGLM